MEINKKRKSSIDNLERVGKTTTTVDNITADIIEQSKKQREEAEKNIAKAIRDTKIPKKDLENGFTGRTNKKITSPQLKKMHLSESLFEEDVRTSMAEDALMNYQDDYSDLFMKESFSNKKKGLPRHI